MHQLTFDDNGFIMPRTGSFNESMVDQILFRRSRAVVEAMPTLQEEYSAHIQPVHAPHVSGRPSFSAKHTAAHRSVYPEMPFVRPSSRSVIRDEHTEAHGLSPTCDSSPEVQEVEAEHNIGISEASSTPQDQIELLSRQEQVDLRPLTPPSSAGGVMQGSWEQYARMVDDVISSIARDEHLCHTGNKKNVLIHLQRARDLCLLQLEEETCTEQE